MAVIKVPNGCLASSWNAAADADKFQFRSGSKSTVLELAQPLLAEDDFSSDPLGTFLTEDQFSGGDLRYHAVNKYVYIYWASGLGYAIGYVPGMTSKADQYIKCKIDFVTGGFPAIIGRYDPVARTGYMLMQHATAGTIELKKFSGTSISNLSSGRRAIYYNYGDGRGNFKTWYWAVLYIKGTSIKAKWWYEGDPEPKFWMLEGTDSTYSAAGKAGIYGRGWNSGGCWKNFSVYEADFPSDSPVRYAVWDSSTAGSTWAGGATRIKYNVAGADSGTGKVKEAYSDTLYGSGDEAAVNALASDTWLEPDGSDEVTLAGGTGRYRYLLHQFNSDGAQQTSLGIWDEGQEVTITTGGAAPGAPSITSVTAGDTEVVLTIDAATESDVVYARYRTPGGSWSAESETFGRTGDGNITITELTNNQRYQFGIYAKTAAGASDWDFIWAEPTDGANAPAGIYALPLYYLQKSLAASANFQTLVDVESADEALDYIHKVETKTMTPPFAVVDWGENILRSEIAGGAHNWFVQGGDLVIILRMAIDAAHDAATAADVFMTRAGGIMADIEALAGTGGYLNVVETELNKPQRPNEDSITADKDAAGNLIGDYYQAEIIVKYGGV